MSFSQQFIRRVGPLLIFLGLLFPPASPAFSAEPSSRPITTDRSPVGDLLRQWQAQGTAAGNTGDFYDNRDREHSPLDLSPYPQLQKISYTPEQRARNQDWAAQMVMLPNVVFGNSSTAAHPLAGGSNTRLYYTSPQGLSFLYQQYTHNNLYIYPCHLDHNPGHNGHPGWGDLFPANTPYLITSQGSSGADRPFMRAVPLTLAAFRPEVKQKLIDTGLLMPTLHMIFRSSNKHLASPDDYLTGKAHPTIFEGSWVDDLKMVRLAHEITLDTIPPMIQLHVKSEDQPVNGRDFFEPAGTESLGDTPAAIARVFRGAQQKRRMVVSAERSADLNSRPLKFRWVVLRGDVSQITIKPLNQAGAVAEIVVSYPERRPVAQGAALESNRIDIGAFAHNGAYWSAPAFVSFFSLDSEARTYDDNGRIVEIGYGKGQSELTVSNWSALFDALLSPAPTPAIDLLKRSLKPEDLATIPNLAAEYKKAYAAQAAAQDRQKQAEAAAKIATNRDKADAYLKTVSEAMKSATAAATDLLSRKQPGFSAPVKELIEATLSRLMGDPILHREQAELLAALLKTANPAQRNAYQAARRRLISAGLAADRPTDVLELQPLLPDGFTRCEQAMLHRFNADLLAGLMFPGLLNATFEVNYVDPAISVPKTWRDVYHYSPDGQPLGWTRYDIAATYDFAPSGKVVLETDAKGQPHKLRAVRYQQPPATSPGRNRNPLKQIWAE